MLMRLGHNVVNMAATAGAVTKLGRYYSVMKQNWKDEIFMACCAFYFGVVYLYFCTKQKSKCVQRNTSYVMCLLLGNSPASEFQ